MARLQVNSGPLAGQMFEVAGDLVIGSADADITIDDAEVSLRHAIVRHVSGAIEVEDLGSASGTFVNGDLIDGPTRVGGGAQIKVGSTVLEVEGVLPKQPTVMSTAADRDATIIRTVPQEMSGTAPAQPAATGQVAPSAQRDRAPAAASRASAAPSVPIGEFRPPTRRRQRGLASRSWIPVLLSFGTVVLTAVALVIYFAAR